MKKILLSLSVILTVFCNVSFADSLDSTYQGWWANLGLGFGAGSSLSGIAGEASLNYAPSSTRLWTLRALEIPNFGGLFADSICNIFITPGQPYHQCADERSVGEVGAMYGLMGKNDFGYISGSAGLGLVDLQTPDIYINNVKVVSGHDSYTPGIPLEVQAFWTPFKYVGVGVIGYGDVNTQKSFGGALLALQFGLLK